MLKFKISFLNNFNNKPIGVTTKKYNVAKTIGAIIRPSKFPNFIQAILKGVKILDFIIANISKIDDKIRLQILMSLKLWLLKTGQKAINKKTILNNTPKLLLELFFDFIKFLLNLGLFEVSCLLF